MFSDLRFHQESPGEIPTPQQAIRAELVEMFHQRAPWPLVVLNIVLAVLLLVVWWEPGLAQWVWFCAISGVALVNILRHQRYQRCHRRGKADSLFWYRSFTRGVIALGIAWGAAGVLFYNPEMPLHSAVVLLIICGVAAGIAASQASIWPSVLCFSFLAILPAAVYAIYVDGLIHTIVGGLLLFYLGYILVVGRMNHQTLVDSVRLRLDKQQLLEEMASSEQQFRALVENLPSLLTVIAHDGRFLFESPSSEKILGYPPGSLKGQPALSLIHPQDQPRAQRAIEQALAQGYANAELRLCDAAGNWRLFDCAGRRLADRHPPALVVNAHDISEHHAMEEALRQARDHAEQASRVKSQFLATVSHEIRTPMHAILGMAEMLRQTELDPRQSGYVDTFHSAGSHLLNLINDILDYSRLEAGGLPLASSPFDLHRLLEEIIALLRPQAEAKGLALQFSLASDVVPCRIGDAQRLKQVLVNLLSNGIKFTREGTVAIEVERQGEGRLYFAVHDTGMGIAADAQHDVFKPFVQLDAGSTRAQGGTGLGLSICHHLVGAMGGELQVVSAPDQGSRFFFTINLPASEADGHPAPNSTQPQLHGALPQMSLLIADDSLMNQRVMEAFLQDCPCQIHYAENGLEALERFRRLRPDLVFMDMQMPKLDGAAATREIRAWEVQQGWEARPIIALSASAMEEDRQRALAAGCNEFHAKPLAQEALFALLRRYQDGVRG